jgi:oxygen-dependent protoporphyrinogen oxidase
LSHPGTNSVAIIGGGLSGLSTAVHLHLADPSIEITLLEASGRIGGVIDTERAGDFLIDCGADMFATQPPAAIKLLNKIGVEDQLILPQQHGRGARIVHRGRLIDLPDGFVLMRATKLWPMMTTPLLSLPGKLRFLWERWIRQPSSSAADVSVAQFVRRRLGDEVLQNIVGPLVAGIYTADVEKLSMEATMGPMANMVRKHGSLANATAARRRSGEDKVERGSSGARYEQFRAFAGGMIRLIDSLAQSLPAGTIRTTAAVDAVRRTDSQWEVRVNGDRKCFDQVVIATPPAIAAGLLAEISATATQDLSAIESASTAIVVLAVPRIHVAADVSTFGFVVPPNENRRILAASFASNKFAGRAPADHVLIRVFIGGMLQPQLLEHSDSDLVQLAQEELADLIGLSGEPTLFRVVRWNHAMPQYHVGHRQRVARIEAAIEELPGIWLVNNALHGVGIAPVIQASENLAIQIAASLQ